MTHRMGGQRLAYGQLGGQSRTFIETGGIRVEDGNEVERVALGKLGSGSYGLRVNNPSGTVIIDGTSDMFRISASGTLSKAVVNGDNSVVANVALPGLGALSAPLAHVSHIWLNNIVSDDRRPGMFIAINGVAGGALTPPMGAYLASYLDGSDHANVRLVVTDANSGPLTVKGRYYLLEQVAI
jgi:hypothetical protein